MRLLTVRHQLNLRRNTPKALANFNPGLLQPWEKNVTMINLNPERVGAYMLNAFSVCSRLRFVTQGCRKLQPWAEISQRLRRICPFLKLHQYRFPRLSGQLLGPEYYSNIPQAF